MIHLRFYGLCLLLFLAACSSEKEHDPLPQSKQRFQLLTSSQTGIDFENKLSYDRDFNIFTYRNFYNGGGVAAGDLNQDGLVDLYFTANMKGNSLYLNKGDFHFDDVSKKAGAQGERSWSTGVSLVDINSDGKLDIYVCNSGDVKGDNKANELFVNQGNDEKGVPQFKEMAASYGLADQGFSTHAAFFDYDRDGDLDCYVLNNSYKAIGSFDLKKNERQKRDSAGGDRLYRNDNGNYVDVSEAAGLYGSVIGFGLGVTVGDVNRDGWQDLFISNDFFERDYLYLNNQDGTFSEVLPKAMQSVSAASMGADMADLNNDGWAEIFVTDMLPEPDDRIKQVTTFDDWNRYQLLLDADYYHQFTRNMLHMNRGISPEFSDEKVPAFTEVSRYAGVEATDWSWGALLFDMDMDGQKDLFIANGIFQDLTDQDYLNFIAADETKAAAVSGGKVDFRKLIDPMPSVPVSNYAYRNIGKDGGIPQFEQKAPDWGLDKSSFSNGSAYADLDNDGDLDLIINNVNMEAFVYRNQSRQQNPERHYLRVALQGKEGNTQALGTRLTAYGGGKTFLLEQMPVRGFQSTMDERPLFALGEIDKLDSLVVTWPEGSISVLRDLGVDTTVSLSWTEASPLVQRVYSLSEDRPAMFEKLASGAGLNYQHKENTFVDFNRDRMVYNMRSTEGPCMCTGDFDGDGREDVFIGGAKDSQAGLFVQRADGSFIQMPQEAFTKDYRSEDTGCAAFDADGDGDLDLYVASGGNEFPTTSSSLGDRLYLNNRGVFTRKQEGILPAGDYESTRAVAAADYDQDGDTDLFVGVRLTPFKFGTPGNGYLLNNDGKGNFAPVEIESLESLGLITDAMWKDIDGDKDQDLIVVGEWMAPSVWINEKGTLQKSEAGLGALTGWWQSVMLTDLNGDKLPDMVLGNHGLNSRCAAETGKPLKMFVKDFDKNGTPEQFLCRYENGKMMPFIRRHDLAMQLPKMKKRYLEFNSYVGQSINDMYTEEELADAQVFEATTMTSMLAINQGDGTFKATALPAEAQLAPLYALSAYDVNKDGKQDLIVGGNLYAVKPEMGRYDALHGLVMLGDGKGGFKPLSTYKSGIWNRGEMRDLAFVKAGSKRLLVAAMNNSPLAVYELK